MTDEPDLIDVSETQDVQEIELPRWVQVPVGIMLSLFTLLCGLASAYLLFVPNKRAPTLAFVVGFILLLGCAWVLEKCFRLITGRQKRGGLMTPRALRVVSFFLLIFPVVGSFPAGPCSSPPVPPCSDARFAQVEQYSTNAISNYRGLVFSLRRQSSGLGTGLIQFNYTLWARFRRSLEWRPFRLHRRGFRIPARSKQPSWRIRPRRIRRAPFV